MFFLRDVTYYCIKCLIMNLKITILCSLLFHASANEKLYDCMDAEDSLRCRKTCPEKRIIKDKNCPLNRICCYGKPTNIFLYFRNAPFYKVPRTDNTTFMFPNSLYDDLIKRHNKTAEAVNITISGISNVTTEKYIELTYNFTKNKIEHKKISNNNIIKNTDTPERKSIKYCEKYTDLTYDYLHASPVLPKMIPFTIPMENCIPLINPLIVGGVGVLRGEFPHMAAIGYNKTDHIDYLCGGTLISEKFVLTAGHCTSTKWGQPVVVMLGSNMLYAEEGTVITVSKVISHPDYKSTSYYNDIGLLELNEEVKFSRFVRPACLALPSTHAEEPGSVNVATGWGKIGPAFHSSLKLLKVKLQIMNHTECEKHYVSDRKLPALNEGINENLLCAIGYINKFDDTCQGDSGGPLQSFIPGHKCVLEVVGITSFGKSCGTGIPAVYTKVESYIPWIEKIVWP